MASNTNENNVIPEIRKLSDIFEEAYNLYNSFDKRDDPTNGIEFQVSCFYFYLCVFIFKSNLRMHYLIN